MKLRELTGSTTLQGFVILEEFDEDKQKCRELWRSFEDSDLVWFPAEYRDRTINYMYAATRNARPGYEKPALIVELVNPRTV